MPDFDITDLGTSVMFQPLNEAAEAWWHEYITAEPWAIRTIRRLFRCSPLCGRHYRCATGRRFQHQRTLTTPPPLARRWRGP